MARFLSTPYKISLHEESDIPELNLKDVPSCKQKLRLPSISCFAVSSAVVAAGVCLLTYRTADDWARSSCGNRATRYCRTSNSPCNQVRDICIVISSIFGRPFVKRFAHMLSDRCLSVCMSVCLSVTLVYCGQRVVCIKMKLRTEVGFDPVHIVLDGDPTPGPSRGNSHHTFGPCLLWLNGWMDQDTT